MTIIFGRTAERSVQLSHMESRLHERSRDILANKTGRAGNKNDAVFFIRFFQDDNGNSVDRAKHQYNIQLTPRILATIFITVEATHSLPTLPIVVSADPLFDPLFI